MVTPTLAVTRPRGPLRTAMKVLLAILVLALLAGAGAATWVYVEARAALPQLDGRIQVAGLSAPVTVMRDGQGVPHISAANLEDLFFAQGYVTAQDRLWQIDWLRRSAAGELAEVVGSAALEHDRQQRILGLRAASERTLQELSPEDRSHFEAYARGLNAFIETHVDRLPLEFRLMRYRPKAWSAVDSVLIGAEMAQELNLGDAYLKLWRERVTARVGPELAADLYPTASWRDHPPGQDGGEVQPEAELRSATMLAYVSAPAPCDTPACTTDLVLGSNNWVISGAHTVAGKPLLSNDPHLGYSVPGIWYEVHLRAPDFDVAGVTLPGLPCVILGHNRRIAWGFTNVGPDVTDLFVETFNERGEYQTPNGWRKAEQRREVIHVKDAADVVLDVITTRHGPIVSDLARGETRRLALQWTLYEPHGMGFPYFRLDAAQNWDEFRQALSGLGSPGQNVVYADVDGHIGYQATGMVPLRASGTNQAPVPGNDDAHAWTGYIPFDKMPRVFDPPSGILATANGRITPDGYPYSVTTQWGPPYRTQRIYRVLQADKKFSAADMLALQLDIYSGLDRFFADRFVYAVDHAKNASARAREAADLMRGWNGRMEQDSVAATLAVNARSQLMRLLLESHLGPADTSAHSPSGWRQYRWPMATVWLENIVQRQPQRWLPPGYPDYGQLLTAAVEAVVADKTAPADLGSWKWGGQNLLRLRHPILGNIPILNRWTDRTLPQSGSPLCVKAVSGVAGPSERMTVDLADLDASTLNLMLGVSGAVFSRHFMDQFNAWDKGQTYRLPFTDAALAKAKAHEMMLEPK